MRKTWIFLVVPVLLLSCKTRESKGLHEIYRFASSGWTHDVALAGNSIYISDREGGFSVFNRAQDYKRMRHTVPIRDVISLAPNSGMPVLASGIEGLVLLSASGQITGRYVTKSIFNAVEVRENIAFAANGEQGLVIARLTQGQVQKIASLPSRGWSHDLRLSRDQALMADWHCGLRVVDIRDPEKPVELSSLPSPATCISLSVRESGDERMLALAEGNAGITVARLDSKGRLSLIGRNYLGLNPGDPTHPKSGGWVHGVAWAGRYLFAANWRRGLAVLDIQNPQNPKLVLEVPTKETSLAVETEQQADGSYLVFLADGGSGLRIFRFEP
jgi:hypothetical protein